MASVNNDSRDVLRVPEGHAAKGYVVVAQRNDILLRASRRGERVMRQQTLESGKVKIAIELVNTVVGLLDVHGGSKPSEGAVFGEVLDHILLDAFKFEVGLTIQVLCLYVQGALGFT